MRPRIDGPSDPATITPHAAPLATAPDWLRDAEAVAELFIGVCRRDALALLPHLIFEPLPGPVDPRQPGRGPNFRLSDGRVEMFGHRYRVGPRDGSPLPPQDRRMIQAIGDVLQMRYDHLFRMTHPARLELYRGGSEDHYIAAYVDPEAYRPSAVDPSRIASTIQTLRTAALSTYENRRVSTGALLVGPGGPRRRTPPDALVYGSELTGLKSIHRLCDGKRTLFLVDPAGRLAEIIDIERWAAEFAGEPAEIVPCARAYGAHARATRTGGHVCLVLSPNQEIKLFAEGAQMFAFAHGRWRILDPQLKYATWESAVGAPSLARVLFQAALELAEGRQGGLFVVVRDPAAAVGRLVAPFDVLGLEVPGGPPPVFDPRDPLAKRALHYLARGRRLTGLDPSVLEALASLDGALVADVTGRLLAFGAILRNDPADPPIPIAAEGARTTAALTASRFGPVLKVSEDGIVTCFLDGTRAWDL
jgi:hypothetical protein